MEKRSRIQILFSLAMLLLFGALFLAGTFFDESLAAAFYSPGNTVIGIITSTGVYPFFSAFVLFSGALFERALHCVKNKPLKIVLCIVCIAVAAYLGYFAGEMLASKSCFGYFFPSVIGNFPVIAGICLIFEYPLFFLGYRLARTSDDKLLVRRIIGLFVILALAYVTMTMLKSTFPRPRYRSVVLGYEGVGFVPWYAPISGAGELAEMYGLSGDEFRSFPSGHSILGVSSIYILPSLSWLSPKLKDKSLMLCFAGLLFGGIIMTTRMIVGAHYLSDVSAGAIIATLLSLCYAGVQIIIEKTAAKRSDR